MDVAESTARESLRELVARYNQYGDRGRFDEMLRLFADDAVLEIGRKERYEGIGAIRQCFEDAVGEDARLLRHFTATLTLDLDDERLANGACYFAVLTEHGLDHWGRYQDRYTRIGGEWRFAFRRVVIEGRQPGGWAERRGY